MTASIEALGPLPATPDTDPQGVVDAITAQARTSFSAGMRLLSRPRRNAMHAVYAFARVLDDIADGDWSRAEKLRLLDAWRGEVVRLHDGAPVSIIGRALAGPVERYGLPRDEFLLLIEAMEMDARGAIVAPSMRDLRAYTRRAAGSVGMLSMRIFGAWRGSVSKRAALALGDAFQLTNILRDVAEDTRRDRVYLPHEALAAAGIVSQNPDEVARHSNLCHACAEVGRLARADFATARRAMAEHGRLAIAPALMMTGVYEGYLAEMEARDFRHSPPVTMSRGRKLWRGVCSLAGPVAPRGHG